MLIFCTFGMENSFKEDNSIKWYSKQVPALCIHLPHLFSTWKHIWNHWEFKHKDYHNTDFHFQLGHGMQLEVKKEKKKTL